MKYPCFVSGTSIDVSIMLISIIARIGAIIASAPGTPDCTVTFTSTAAASPFGISISRFVLEYSSSVCFLCVSFTDSGLSRYMLSTIIPASANIIGSEKSISIPRYTKKNTFTKKDISVKKLCAFCDSTAIISDRSSFVFSLFRDNIVLLFPSISPKASAAIAPFASMNGLSTNAYSAITTAIVTKCALLKFLNLNNVNVHRVPITAPTINASENDVIMFLNTSAPVICPDTMMFIIVIAPMMHNTSLIADSSTIVLACFLFSGSILTRGITTALDIPPSIIPNRRDSCMLNPNKNIDNMLVMIVVKINDMKVRAVASFTELNNVLKSIASAP